MQNYIILATFAGHAAISKENFHKYIKESNVQLSKEKLLMASFHTLIKNFFLKSSTCMRTTMLNSSSKQLNKTSINLL